MIRARKNQNEENAGSLYQTKTKKNESKQNEDGNDGIVSIVKYWSRFM